MAQRTLQLNYISDVHLEWLFDKRGHLIENILHQVYLPLFRCNRQPETEYNALIIAGDFTESRKWHYFVPFLEQVQLENQYDAILYVPGNHEYYGDSIQQANARIKEVIAASDGLHGRLYLLNNETCLLDKGRVQVLGAPYWYRVAPSDEFLITQRLSDFRRIKTEQNGQYRKLRYLDVLAEHRNTLRFLKQMLSATPNSLPTVLVTHHPASCLFSRKRTGYRGDYDIGYGTPLPQEWALDLTIGLADKVVACIHGHAHQHGPVMYQNEYDIPSYSNTIGYFGEEFKPDSHAGLRQITNGLPFVML